MDQDRYASIIQHHIANGTKGVVPAGTTGESPTLNHEEHKKVIEIAVKECKGKIPVIAGTGSNSTAEAVELSKHAEKSGADGLLIVTPYYNKPTKEGLYQHFKAVAKASALPLMLYSVPGRSVIQIDVETAVRLAHDCETVVSIKEAGGSSDRVNKLVQAVPESFTVRS